MFSALSEIHELFKIMFDRINIEVKITILESYKNFYWTAV